MPFSGKLGCNHSGDGASTLATFFLFHLSFSGRTQLGFSPKMSPTIRIFPAPPPKMVTSAKLSRKPWQRNGDPFKGDMIVTHSFHPVSNKLPAAHGPRCQILATAGVMYIIGIVRVNDPYLHKRTLLRYRNICIVAFRIKLDCMDFSEISLGWKRPSKSAVNTYYQVLDAVKSNISSHLFRKKGWANL